MKKNIKESIEKATVVSGVAKQIERMELDGRSEETTGMLTWFAEYLEKSMNEYEDIGTPQDDEEELQMLEYLGVLGELQMTLVRIRFGGMLDE